MPAPAPPVDPAAFTAAAAAHLAAAGLSATVAGPLALTVALPGGRTATLRLHSLWWPVRSGAPVDDALARLLSTVEAQARPPAPDRARVLPYLRETAALAGLRAASPLLPARALLPGLSTTYMAAGDDHLRQLRRVDADLLQLDDAALHALACANLARLGPPRLVGGGTVRRLALDGAVDASALLLRSLWDELEDGLGEAVLVAVPSPARLLLCPARAGPGPLLDALGAARLAADHPFRGRWLLRRGPTGARWLPVAAASASDG